jgi:RNA polymerase sigma factor (sigma-70 family)
MLGEVGEVTQAVDLRRSDLEDAWQGFCQLLRAKGFSQHFIERDGEDLLGQAQLELLRALAAGTRISNPTGWIIHCAWRRTQNLLEERGRRGETVSDNALAPLRSGEPTPEQELAARADSVRVQEAVRSLPFAEREIVRLIYGRRMSCRRAARLLGWHPSKAQRRHEAALIRLRPLVEREDPRGASAVGGTGLEPVTSCL